MIKRTGARRCPGLYRVAWTLQVLLLLLGPWCLAQEVTNAAAEAQVQVTNSPNAELSQTLQKIQEQLEASTAAIEQNRKELREAGLHTAEALSSGLQSIENVYTANQELFFARTSTELEAIRDSNRLTLIVACGVAGMAVLSMMFMAYHQWRLSKISVGLTNMLPASDAPLPALLDQGSRMIDAGAIEDSNGRLLGAMERLQKRIETLEASFGTSLNLQTASVSSRPEPQLAGAPNGGTLSQISGLLDRGQALLKEDRLESAVKLFDDVLSLNPNHSEALVKKGAALERLKKLAEASECYDRAIAADTSMTIAYLHKAGLCSRMQRFNEALECYEKALQTHDEWHR